jgi:hypothetical protein
MTISCDSVIDCVDILLQEGIELAIQGTMR